MHFDRFGSAIRHCREFSAVGSAVYRVIVARSSDGNLNQIPPFLEAVRSMEAHHTCQSANSLPGDNPDACLPFEDSAGLSQRGCPQHKAIVNSPRKNGFYYADPFFWIFGFRLTNGICSKTMQISVYFSRLLSSGV
jgi:hypothetical protein